MPRPRYIGDTDSPEIAEFFGAQLGVPAAAEPVPPLAATAMSDPVDALLVSAGVASPPAVAPAPGTVSLPDPAPVLASNPLLGTAPAVDQSRNTLELDLLRRQLAEQTAQVQLLQQQSQRAEQERMTLVEKVRAEKEAAEQQLVQLRAEQEFLKFKPSGLETLDDVAAEEVYTKLVAPQLAKMSTTYQAQLKELSDKIATTKMPDVSAELERFSAQSRQDRTDSAILQVHPDILAVTQNNPAWDIFASRTIPHSTRTFREEVASAYNSGNAKYVNDVVSLFKGQQAVTQPSVSVLVEPAQTSAVQVATHPAQQTKSFLSLAAYNEAFARYRKGGIPREQWARLNAAWEEALAEGRTVA